MRKTRSERKRRKNTDGIQLAEEGSREGRIYIHIWLVFVG